jgi:hypothetical protein
VLTSVYTALDYEWDPATVGSLQQASAQVTADQIEHALRTRMNHGRLGDLDVDPATLELAATLQHRHELD